MRKERFIIVALVLVIAMTSCTSPKSKSGGSVKKTEIIVFAAASLTECFTEIKNTYEEAHEDVEVVLNFAGSQVLKNQIDSGGNPGMYFSANTKYPRALIESGISVGDHKLSEEDINVFAKNQLVIISPWDKIDDLEGFMDIIKADESMIVLANGDVPVGKYTINMLEGLRESFENQSFYDKFYTQVVSYENDVKAVLAKVKLKEADYGIVYGTDAMTAKDSVYQIVIPTQYNQEAVYGSLLLSEGDQETMLYDYITEGNGQKILGTFGFVID